MRKILYRVGWITLFVLPVIYGVQIYLTQDLPPVQPWKWLVLSGVIVLIFFSRDPDDVLKHHVV